MIPVRPRKLRQILWSIFIGGLIGLTLMAIAIARSPESRADENSYLTRLANAGYTGPINKWASMGYDICHLESIGVPTSYIISKIVVTTGSGIYSADAYEIIAIANQELCFSGETYA